MRATIYETQDPDAKPGHRFVALIDYDGFKGASPHLCSFVRAATRETCEHKAADFIASCLDKAKRAKAPAESPTLQEAPDDFPI